MPAHARRRRIPYVLTAAAVAGVIGLGYAGIAAARSSSDDKDAQLTAAAPRDVAPAATEESLPVPSSSVSPSPTLTTSPTPAASPSARPTGSATTPATKPATTRPTTKRPTKKPTKTTQPPAPGNTGGGSSGGDSGTVSEVIRLVNAERKEAGCGSLAGESRLHRAAQKHSDRQADQNNMSHQLPGEASMGDRVTAEGYRWGGVAENVAAGYRTPDAVMEGWMNSAGHKANILNCGYKHIGVGVAKSGDGTLYWTQNFASPL
ncbi:hypothetical protein Aab01nite_61630 [Paractinoplanes abujensis]|uniref:Uncharacterized protein YkwD n=1 Tax=Paractinoplanes abujensis TaxID=882441 RepID=A0A7W7CQL6_9ACTN|nr:CAP domain-containing protein [Actinoplanes abujensis]MBB4692926.1 uncharacterized protein YkwD [Actinoplanes abujensis]GID22573.1 hypothetical protein Aab01nite_61630 [Actinoplanes abujensis]